MSTDTTINQVCNEQLLMNIRPSEEICYCDIHQGDVLHQIDAQLVANGRPVRIMRDKYGFHVSIGRGNTIGEPECPGPVSAAQVESFLRGASR